MIRRVPDESLRAMILTAALLLVATFVLVFAARHIDRDAQAQAATPDFASAVALALSTKTPTPSPAPSPSVAPSSLVPTRASPSATAAPTELATPAPPATETASVTPEPSATLTLEPPTPVPTDTPVPTPSPVLFSLRTDLPPMTLQDWPRPAGDDGWGMHFLVNPWPSEEEIDRNVQRLVDMHIKWALVIYGDEIALQKLAPRFRDAGIMVVWRRFLRPYERYYEWGRDINILQQLGLPPYMQIFNEPSVAAEWPDGQSNQAVYLDNLVYAAQDVYNAGGYVGLQDVSENWLRTTLAEIRARGGEAIFGRMFFIPHSYGMNHPPSYTEDINAVLNFRNFADVFRNEIGFVPPMIVGEGGWKWGATDDARYPKVSDELHRDYYVALYDWFRTGVLSNGEPLPDYLFAFSPWLIAHKMDDNAFYDSFAGDRVMTIEAIKAIPPFVRRFSWQ